MIRMSLKVKKKTRNLNFESMKNHNLLIKLGRVNVLRTISI